MTRLVAVPNVSEGRDEDVLDAIGAAFATHAGRAPPLGRPRPPPRRLLPRRRARASCTARSRPAPRRPPSGSTCARHDGLHPRVGALDVAPVVYLDEAQRGAAIAEALLAADAIGAGRHPRLPLRRARGRAHARGAAPRRARRASRRAGPPPDYGPAALHPARGRDARRRPRRR